MIDKSLFKRLPARSQLFGKAKDKRPFVILKLATTLDGRIATHNGASAWITNELSRAFVHRLRAEADGILVGTRTLEVDDPELTCRLPGLESLSPVRVVLDRTGKLNSDLKVFQTAKETPTWMMTSQTSSKSDDLQKLGVKIYNVAETKHEKIDLLGCLAQLKRDGITGLLVEGGAEIAASLIKAKAVDLLVWFHAPKIMGSDGIPAISALGLEDVSEGPKLKLRETLSFGDDIARLFEVLSDMESE